MPATSKYPLQTSVEHRAGTWGLGPVKGIGVITEMHRSGFNTPESSFVHRFYMLTSPEQSLLGREENLELAQQTKEAGTLFSLGHQWVFNL